MQQSTETSGYGNTNARSEDYEKFAVWDVVLAASRAGGSQVISLFKFKHVCSYSLVPGMPDINRSMLKQTQGLLQPTASHLYLHLTLHGYIIFINLL